MAPKISILDFDLTITKEHTFVKRQLKAGVETTTFQEQFNYGVADAGDNLKDGVQKSPLFKLDDEGLFAIATHHNNPDYVAGYLSVILGKDVTPVIDTQQGNIAVKQYQVEGNEKPLFISYIPQVGEQFATARSQLNGKNEQIGILKRALSTAGLMSKNDMIDFYDDDKQNLNQAKWVYGVTPHQVDAHDSFLKLIREEPFPAKTQPIVSSTGLIHPSAKDAAQINSLKIKQSLTSMKQAGSLDDALRVLHDTGLVYPNTFSRQEAEHRLDEMNGIILRESSTKPGEIVLSYKKSGQYKHDLLNSHIENHLAHFSTPENAIAHIEGIMHRPIDIPPTPSNTLKA